MTDYSQACETQDELRPLDALISGCAFEYATNALGVIEQGANADGWINSETLCTLDNFIKIFLFSDRVFVLPSVQMDRERFVPIPPRFGASERSWGLLNEEHVFVHQQVNKPSQTEEEVLFKRMTTLLRPASHTSNWVVLRCKYTEQPFLEISQEMTGTDFLLIEMAIRKAGLQKFKAVFPGEHLYLGLRQSRLSSDAATHTVADLAARRTRAVIRDQMCALNATVTLGSPPLPVLPPLFVMSLLAKCSDGQDLVEALILMRNSRAVTRFRKWATKCMESLSSGNIQQRIRAVQACQLLSDFKLPLDKGSSNWITILLSAAVLGLKALPSILKQDYVSASASVVSDAIIAPVVQYVTNLPLAFLVQTTASKGSSDALHRFFVARFGETFNRVDMDSVSILLWLQDNVSDWEGVGAAFDVSAGRLYGDDGPPLGRPFRIRTDDPLAVLNAKLEIGNSVAE